MFQGGPRVQPRVDGVRAGSAAEPGVEAGWFFADLGWRRRPLVVEWWLMSAEGELIEVYWQER